MRRIEVVSFIEHLELEVGEDRGESRCDLAELIGVAQPAEREVDRSGEPRQRFAV